MPDIQTLLRDYGEHLEELAPAISTDEVAQTPVAPRRPDPWWQRPAVVVASAAVLVLLVVGGLSLVFGGAQEEPAVTTLFAIDDRDDRASYDGRDHTSDDRAESVVPGPATSR